MRERVGGGQNANVPGFRGYRKLPLVAFWFSGFKLFAEPFHAFRTNLAVARRHKEIVQRTQKRSRQTLAAVISPNYLKALRKGNSGRRQLWASAREMVVRGSTGVVAAAISVLADKASADGLSGTAGVAAPSGSGHPPPRGGNKAHRGCRTSR